MSNCIYCDMPWTGRIPTCEAGYFECPDSESCKGFKGITHDIPTTVTSSAANNAPTHGDMVRAMNDEELFAFLKEIKKRARICQTARIDDSELCSLDWLRQPAGGM